MVSCNKPETPPEPGSGTENEKAESVSPPSEPAATTEASGEAEKPKAGGGEEAPSATEASSAPAAKDQADAIAALGSVEKATFGGGCFWCIEAVMERLEGVTDARSGYMGGHVENPTYEQVCEKNTGHIEVVEVTFEPEKISYDELLEVFWQVHDPTSRDQQGADKGPQYRSAVFYHDEAQKAATEASIKALEASGKLDKAVVTEVLPLAKLWVAEDYHQDFFAKNPGHGYCRLVIHPKLKKLEEVEAGKEAFGQTSKLKKKE